MTPLSRLLSYNETYLDPKIPEDCRFKGNPEGDYPFFLAKGLLTPRECDAILHSLLAAGEKGSVKINVLEEGKGVAKTDKGIRDTRFFHFDETGRRLYRAAFDAIRPELEAFFNITLEKTEGIQILGYGEGGHYKLHADNAHPHYEEGKFTHWETTKSHRKITTILFLTRQGEEEGFGVHKGGEVTFDYLKYEDGSIATVRPQPGLFLAFPSNPYFSHRVHPVQRGFRVSVVEWWNGEYGASRRQTLTMSS